MSVDPRDEGRQGPKEWEEFRATFAASFLAVLLLETPGLDLREWLSDLWEAIDGAEFAAEGLPRLEDVPVVTPGGRWHFFTPEQALSLKEQLFPRPGSHEEYSQLAHGLAVVALYASLDAYAKALGMSLSKLPFATGAAIENEIAELHATRNTIVHNRGTVDEKYAQLRPLSELHIGERRTVTQEALVRFAQAVWRTASRMRDHTATGG
jgi:hypothetical protein